MDARLTPACWRSRPRCGMSVLVDLPERQANWQPQGVGIGNRIGVDLFGEATRQFSTAHTELVGSASGGPQQRGHTDGKFDLFIRINAIDVISGHRGVSSPPVMRSDRSDPQRVGV
jgi:hypothetical protein